MKTVLLRREMRAKRTPIWSPLLQTATWVNHCSLICSSIDLTQSLRKLIRIPLPPSHRLRSWLGDESGQQENSDSGGGGSQSEPQRGRGAAEERHKQGPTGGVHVGRGRSRLVVRLRSGCAGSQPGWVSEAGWYTRPLILPLPPLYAHTGYALVCQVAGHRGGSTSVLWEGGRNRRSRLRLHQQRRKVEQSQAPEDRRT